MRATSATVAAVLLLLVSAASVVGAWAPQPIATPPLAVAGDVDDYYPSPQVAARPDGTTLVAWIEKVDAVTHELRARPVSPTGVPGPILTLSDSGAFVREFDLSVGAGGVAILAWHQCAAQPCSVKARRLTPDGGLGPLRDVSTPSANAVVARAAVRADGSGGVGWYEIDGAAAIAKFRPISADGSLGGTQDLSGAGEKGFLNDLDASPDGSLLAVYSSEIPIGGFFGYLLKARRIGADGALGVVKDITSPQTDARDPRLGFAPDGTATLAWDEGPNNSSTVVRARRLSSADALGPTADLSGATAAAGPLAVHSDGAVTFTWQQGGTVFARRMTPTGGLGPAVPVANPAGIYDVAPGPGGSAVLLLAEGEGAVVVGSRTIVRTRSIDAGGNVTAPQDVSDPAIDSGGARLAFGPADPIFVWTDILPTSFRVIARSGAGASPPPTQRGAPSSPGVGALPGTQMKKKTIVLKPSFSLVTRGGRSFIRIRVSVSKLLARRALIVERKIGKQVRVFARFKVPKTGKVDVKIPANKAGRAKSIKLRLKAPASAMTRSSLSPFRTVVLRRG